MNNRLRYYDNAKVLLMFSVILGHLLQNNGLNDSVSIGLFDTIFMYSMPLFVFISGLFSAPNKRTTGSKFFYSLLNIFEPLVIFSILLALPSVFISGFSKDLIRPGYTLWYLLALIWYRVIFYLLPDSIQHHKITFISILVLISLASGVYLRFEGLALPRTLFFLPYFGLGFCLADKREILIRYVKKIPRLLSVIVLLLVFALNSYFSYNQLPYNTGNVPYADWNMGLQCAIVWRIVFSVICVVVSVCVLNLVPSGEIKVTKFGSKTLVIYVYHAVVLTIIKYICEYMGGAQNIYMALIEFLIVTPLLIIISKNKMATFIISPISNSLKRKHNKAE